MESKIKQLMAKQSALAIEKTLVEQEIDAIIIAYHGKLIACYFYELYVLDGKSLDKTFYIRPNSLPYQDHGEGDYIRITIEVDGNSIEIGYECSYGYGKNHTLLTIPLEIMDGELTTIEEFVFTEIDTKNKLASEAKLKADEETKKQQIANLKLQLKNLGA